MGQKAVILASTDFGLKGFEHYMPFPFTPKCHFRNPFYDDSSKVEKPGDVGTLSVISGIDDEGNVLSVEALTLRAELNKHYDAFVLCYGHLNSKKNNTELSLDAGAQEIFFLERSLEGKFVKADIFFRPTAFSVDTLSEVAMSSQYALCYPHHSRENGSRPWGNLPIGDNHLQQPYLAVPALQVPTPSYS